MAYRPQPVLLDVKTETLMDEALLNITTFFEQLLHVPAHDWSFSAWLQSRQNLQQADRIIHALLIILLVQLNLWLMGRLLIYAISRVYALQLIIIYLMKQLIVAYVAFAAWTWRFATSP